MSKSLHLHCWDPGVTTGYARVVIEDVEAPSPRVVVKETSTFDDEPHQFALFGIAMKPVWAELWDAVEVHHLFVVERFRLFEFKALDQSWSKMPAAVSFGRIEVVAVMLNVHIVEQPPSNMQAFHEVAVLAERLGLTPKELPKTEHERDALRHAAYFYYAHRKTMYQMWKNASPGDVLRQSEG